MKYKIGDRVLINYMFKSEYSEETLRNEPAEIIETDKDTVSCYIIKFEDDGLNEKRKKEWEKISYEPWEQSFHEDFIQLNQSKQEGTKLMGQMELF